MSWIPDDREVNENPELIVQPGSALAEVRPQLFSVGPAKEKTEYEWERPPCACRFCSERLADAFGYNPDQGDRIGPVGALEYALDDLLSGDRPELPLRPIGG